MEQCKQYKSKIEDILKRSDLSTITTKSVRRELEAELGISLSDIKKEINEYIEELFLEFEERRQLKERLTVKQNDIKIEPGNKVTKKVKTTTTVKKQAVSKKKEPKERKPIDWPLLKVTPPLSDIIKTELCSRPQTVKKMWEYIREHKLQSESDKRIINCDDKFKQLSGEDTITAFSMNKYTQKHFIPIPKEEQPKYKEILRQQEESKEASTLKTQG